MQYVQPPVDLAPAVVKKLKHTGGKSGKLLKSVATDPALGASRPLRLIPTSALTQRAPSAVGAAFDLGAGPTALFVALLAAAALLALGGGLRRSLR